MIVPMTVVGKAWEGFTNILAIVPGDQPVRAGPRRRSHISLDCRVSMFSRCNDSIPIVKNQVKSGYWVNLAYFCLNYVLYSYFEAPRSLIRRFPRNKLVMHAFSLLLG